MIRPILFSAPMVRAILAGQKTQTRRVIKPQPFLTASGLYNWKGNLFGRMNHESGGFTDYSIADKSPYGIGQLWVRETFRLIWKADGCLYPEEECKPNCDGCKIEYRADTGNKHPGNWPDDEGDDPDCPKWKPSIFMPRLASRITLKIIDVRVERLQDITEADAKAEGVWGKDEPYQGVGDLPTDRYRALWDSINGKKYPWKSNPWLFVITFRRIDK